MGLGQLGLEPAGVPAAIAGDSRRRYVLAPMLTYARRLGIVGSSVGASTAVLAMTGSAMIGHGVALLESEPNRRVVLDWLERHLD